MNSTILLPPSEGKSLGGKQLKRHALSLKSNPLLPQRLELLGVLQDVVKQSYHDDNKTNQKLFGVKGEALERAVHATLALQSAPVMAAFDRYTGVLYDAIDTTTFTHELHHRARESILIFSGLFGVVTPEELIPDYRLKMGATLPGIGKVSTWWRPYVTQAVQPRVADQLVWNLLPQEHNAAWTPLAAGYRPSEELKVKFVMQDPSGDWKVVNHWNKLLKGALVRFLLEHPAATVDDLVGWQHPEGYVLEIDFALQNQAKLESWQRELYFVKRQKSRNDSDQKLA